MKKKECIRMAIIAIILILIVVVTIIMFVLMKKGALPNLFESEGTSVSKEKIEALDWSTDIVSNITTENVPIPRQYSYVSGNIETGTIIEDKNGCYYLWVPYTKDVTKDASEYYTNVSDYYEMESDEMASIEKYNGFYVALNMSEDIDSLKTISNDKYTSYADTMNAELEDNTQRHLLSKEEIEQINTYMENEKFDIADNTIGIEATTFSVYSPMATATVSSMVMADSEAGTVEPIDDNEINTVENMEAVTTEPGNEENSTNIGENQNTENNEDTTGTNEAEIVNEAETVYMLKTEQYPQGVPIPYGYKKAVTDGIVTIQDATNNNLVYVWVPLSAEELTTRKSELKSLYENYTNADGEKLKFDEGSELYKVFNNTKEELPEEFVESIKKWGGFYISEAELSYDSSNNFYNKARGMVGSTVRLTRYGGDYFRGSTTQNFTYDNVIKTAESVTANSSTVVSHLMYGVEYDATVLWINRTNSNYQDKNGKNMLSILLEDSTSVGKYRNTGWSANSTAEKSAAFFNKIWGLGGNLSEITQERAGNSYVVRGGSAYSTGEDEPIASRKITDEISSDMVGFRTCLYVKPDLKETNKETEAYTPTVEDDTVFYIGDYTFDIWKEQQRFVNSWDGLIIYSEPDLTSNVITTLGFANSVAVNAKAKEMVKDSNGNDLWWIRVRLADGSIGYANAQAGVTDKTQQVGNRTFIMKEKVTRYHVNKLVVYTSCDESSSQLATIDFTGGIEVVGKSIDFEWAAVKVNGKVGYVKASNLKVKIDLEKIGDYSFYVGDPVQRGIGNEQGAGLRQNPGDESTSGTAPYGITITMDALSEDGKIARINYNGSTYFVNASDLCNPGPALEVSINKDTGAVTIKAKNIGRGVKGIYSNGSEVKGNWDGDYYVATLQAYKDEKYSISAKDNEGNTSIYGEIDTSGIKVDDPSKKPVEPTTPTTPSTSDTPSTPSDSGESSGGSSSGSDTEAPKVVSTSYSDSKWNFKTFNNKDEVWVSEPITVWIQVTDNQTPASKIYAYLTDYNSNRISDKITTVEGSNGNEGKYYIAYTISKSNTYYFQICDGSSASDYTWVTITVKGLDSGSSSSGSSSQNPEIDNVISHDRTISVYTSSDTQYINYRVKGYSDWKWIKYDGYPTVFTVNRYATYEVCAGKYDSNGKAYYSKVREVTTSKKPSGGSSSGGGSSSKDKTKPSMKSVTTNHSGWYNGNVTINMYATDNVKVDHFTITTPTGAQISRPATKSSDGAYHASYTVSQEGGGTWSVKAIDSSGNVSDGSKSAYIAIDKTAPTFDFTYHEKNTNIVYQKVRGSDKLSGIYTLELKKLNIDKHGNISYKSVKTTLSNSLGWWQDPTCSYRIVMVDKAGNTRNVHIYGINAKYI